MADASDSTSDLSPASSFSLSEIFPETRYEPQKIEPLIALESESESGLSDQERLLGSLHSDGRVYRDETEFQEELHRLKTKSSQKFRTKWEEILAKYSSIDDEKESDEIDLATGKIVVDNGHLRSLHDGNGRMGNVNIDGNIWAMSYDIDKDFSRMRKREVTKKERKRELKLRLKQQNLFHIHSNSDYNYDNGSNRLKRAPLEDNLLQLNPSPTKKSKSKPVIGSRLSSPVRSEYDSPTKKRIPSHSIHLDSSSPKPEAIKRGSYFELSPTRQDARKLVSSSRTASVETELSFVQSDDDLESETSQTSQVESLENDLLMNEFDTDPNQHKLSYNCKTRSDSQQDKEESSDSDSFDDEYLIISEPYFLKQRGEQGTIYECAFFGCSYCTGNKLLYQSHLLLKHSLELYLLGYPVESREENNSGLTISTDERDKVLKHFPITYAIPPLPSSSNGQVFDCSRLDCGRKCQRFFLTEEDLSEHENAETSQCSWRTQVLLCPLLGCGYITEGGYLEWRAHFIKQGHHIEPETGFKFTEHRNDAEAKASNHIKREHYDTNSLDKGLIFSDDINVLFSDNDDFDSPADDENTDVEEDGIEETGDEETGDEETGDEEASDEEASDKEVGNDETGNEETDDDKIKELNHVHNETLYSLPVKQTRQVTITQTPKFDHSLEVSDLAPEVSFEGYESIEELFSN